MRTSNRGNQKMNGVKKKNENQKKEGKLVGMEKSAILDGCSTMVYKWDWISPSGVGYQASEQEGEWGGEQQEKWKAEEEEEEEGEQQE